VVGGEGNMLGLRWGLAVRMEGGRFAGGMYRNEIKLVALIISR
jgi:hypothetical protein